MQPNPLAALKEQPPSELPSIEKRFRRPSDFVHAARVKGADVSHDNSRWVVRHRGRTIGFSDRGNKEYSKPYRHLLFKAFMAAGLLGILFLFVHPPL